MASLAHTGLRVSLSCCQVQTGHPHAEGNGATVCGLETQLAFSIVLEIKKRVTASPVWPMWGLTPWDLAGPSLDEASGSMAKLARARKIHSTVSFGCLLKKYIIYNSNTNFPDILISLLLFQSFCLFICFCF